MKVHVIIAGGRDLTDQALVSSKMDKIMSNIPKQDIVVVSGKARGADRLGEGWAKSRQIQIEEYPANWDKWGKRAGYIRNEEMAKSATHLVAFWDGVSRGTKHMITLARKEGLKVRVIKYTNRG